MAVVAATAATKRQRFTASLAVLAFALALLLVLLDGAKPFMQMKFEHSQDWRHIYLYYLAGHLVAPLWPSPAEHTVAAAAAVTPTTTRCVGKHGGSKSTGRYVFGNVISVMRHNANADSARAAVTHTHSVSGGKQ